MISASGRSVFSAVLLRRYALLLGSCNVVAATKLAPVASGSPSTSAGYSTKAYPAKGCSPSTSAFSNGYLWLRNIWDYSSPLSAVSTSSSSNPTLLKSRRFCSEEHWTDVDTPELLQLLESGDIQLFDVREPEELEETGRIPRAINLPLGEVESALNMSPEDFHQKYGARKPSKEDSNIVFHCRAGIRSLDAMETAHQLGYKKARHYICGWLGWEEHLDTQGTV